MKNLPLILGVGLPVLLLVVVIIFSFVLPSLIIKPSYNFLYVDNYYSYDANLKVLNQKLIFECSEAQYRNCSDVLSRITFYVYDFSRSANVQISFEDAEKLKLDSSDVSPDGYRFMKGNGGDYFFPFFWGSGDSNAVNIQKGWLSKQIYLKDTNYWNSDFIGWVLE